MENSLTGLSSALASVVEGLGPSIVRIDDGSRLTATGLIWSADGVIVTTSHGVERDDKITVELADGSRHPATLVGRDTDTDLAVLRVNTSNLPAVNQANIEDIKVGHIVLALGRPGELGLQATIGIISARLESEYAGQAEYVLNTDATLYPGFSGGALVDMQGRVVGILNLAFGRGMGVALGTPIANRIANAVLQTGKVQRGYLGVSTQATQLPGTLLKKLELVQERGLLIFQVESNSPAEQGGLLLGDILIGLNNQVIQDVDDLRRQLGSMLAGQQVNLRIVRGGVLQNLNVTLGARD